jgi:hypothetical protein
MAHFQRHAWLKHCKTVHAPLVIVTMTDVGGERKLVNNEREHFVNGGLWGPMRATSADITKTIYAVDVRYPVL